MNLCYMPMFLILIGVGTTAHAIVNESMIPEVVVSDNQAVKRQNEEKAPAFVAQRNARLEAARIRAKKLDNLPHELIVASAEGRLTEEDLKNIPENRPVTAPQALPKNEPVISSGRFFRLLLAGIGVIVLGLTFIAQRWRNAQTLAPREHL